jgi:hypothetical protein
MPPVVRAAGLEPAREPGLSRPPLPIGYACMVPAVGFEPTNTEV